MISVVIPAYNEEAVIERTLESVLSSELRRALEIIVVCNGCRDRTFERASRFGAPVRVFDLEQGSKIAALNHGDSQACGFPRFYLDADIRLSKNALQLVAVVLEEGKVHVAAPRMICDYSNAHGRCVPFMIFGSKLATIEKDTLVAALSESVGRPLSISSVSPDHRGR